MLVQLQKRIFCARVTGFRMDRAKVESKRAQMEKQSQIFWIPVFTGMTGWSRCFWSRHQRLPRPFGPLNGRLERSSLRSERAWHSTGFEKTKPISCFVARVSCIVFCETKPIARRWRETRSTNIEIRNRNNYSVLSATSAAKNVKQTQCQTRLGAYGLASLSILPGRRPRRLQSWRCG